MNAFLAILALTAIDAPRPTDSTHNTAQSVIAVQTCVTRQWSGSGTVTPIPLTDGVALDWQLKTLFLPGKPLMTFEIRDTGPTRTITVGYRHPFNKGRAVKFLDKTVRECGL